MTITTSTGTTVTVEDSENGPLVVFDNPTAPQHLRHIVAGRIVQIGAEQGFQPASVAPWGITPETLRVVADLVEKCEAPWSERPEPECASCPEGMPEGECPKSERPCGHHCNHSWEQDICHWCDTEFGEDGAESAVSS